MDLSSKTRSKKFTDKFPVPDFLLLGNSGITISDSNVKFAQFKKNSKGLELIHFVDIPLTKGAITSGFINNKEEVTKALQYLNDLYNLPYVMATLPEERAYVFTTEIDRVPEADIRDAIAFTIEENAPVSLDKSIFDYDIIGSIDTPKIKVAVTVVTYKGTALYTEVFEAAGISPISFEIESQAIARAIISKGDSRTQLIVNLALEKTGLYIVEEEIIHFTSTAPYGARLDGGAYQDLHNLKTEIRKVFAFWNTRLDFHGVPAKKIEKIIFVGEEAWKEDFIAQMMSDLSIDYSLANVWINALSFEETVPNILFKESLGCAAAVGLSLPREN
ncbi:MAG: pilus assembly protein PilM [bacterium]|nr:pilus assembly protein PilM [bacterium]